MMLRRFLLCLVGATVAMSIPSWAQDEATDQAGVLVVFQGTVTAAGDGTLTMDAPEIVTVFTDRPHRIAQPMVLETFLADAWGEDGPFAQIPPNATLVDEDANTIALVDLFSMTQSDSGLVMRYSLIDGDAPALGGTVAVIIDAVVILDLQNHANDNDDPSVIIFHKGTNPSF
jgi:hypothetical protein